ncbi:hypothetical protein BY458DRAFT_525712 [Sporodiniella umbellata]|nr:hypothetical protein BY458DRAFT_525712 [Sporodiniella umbellata]
MPPIPQLNKAFLGQLITDEPNQQQLEVCIDTTSLTDILCHLNTTFSDLEKELYDCVQQHPSFVSSYETLTELKEDSDRQSSQELSLHYDDTVQLLERHETALRAHELSKAKLGVLEALVDQLEILARCEQELKESQFSKATTTWLSISVMDRLKERAQTVHRQLLARLGEGLKDAVVFEAGSIQVVESPVTILDALEKLGQLTVEMTSMKRMAFKTLVDPFFDEPHTVEVVDGSRLRLVGCTAREPVAQIRALGELVQFFLHQVLADTHQALFGRLFLPDLTARMVESILVPSIPLRDPQAFDPVREAIGEFRARCEGWLVEDTLSAFADEIESHVEKKRKRHVLGEAREVMLRRLYEVEVVDGSHITQTPRLLRLLIMDDPERAQDVLDMYRALMPSYHRPQFLADPASALVFRNDCLWLAEQLPNYPGVQPLKALGKAWQEVCMIQRVDMLQTTLDGLQGFATGQAHWEASLGHAVDLVLEFAEAIRPVVDHGLAQDILGRIVDSVLNRLMGDLEDLAEIGAEESHVIAQTLHRVAQLASIFDSVRTVPTWDKFWLLKDILEMNMRDIMDRFRRGELHTFQKRELENLLCALFSDSDLRRMNIEEIRTGQSSAPLGTRTLMYDPEQTTDCDRAPVNSVSQKSALMYDPGEEETTGWDDEEIQDIQPAFTSRLPPKTSLAYEPEEEEAAGWDDDEELELPASLGDQDGWDDDELELPP